MKTPHPGRTWSILFGLGAGTVFILGAAVWHALIQADPVGCAMPDLECWFVPTRADIGIHLISYALMTPLMAAMFFWFSVWRNQYSHLSALTGSLSGIAIRDDRLDSFADKMGLRGKVRMIDSDDALSFCAFLFSPRIFVSRAVVNSLTDRELEALLAHERYHLDNRDPLRIFLGRSLVTALFFAPVLKDLFRWYLIRKEIAADQAAIALQGQRAGIVGALRKLLELDTEQKSSLAITAGATEELRYRIAYILGRPEKERIELSHLLVSSAVPVLSVLSIVLPRAVIH